MKYETIWGFTHWYSRKYATLQYSLQTIINQNFYLLLNIVLCVTYNFIGNFIKILTSLAHSNVWNSLCFASLLKDLDASVSMFYWLMFRNPMKFRIRFAKKDTWFNYGIGTTYESTGNEILNVCVLLISTFFVCQMRKEGSCFIFC